MNVGTLKVTLQLDTKEFQSALNAVGAQLKQVAAQGVPKINTKGFSDVNAAATQMKKALGEALPVQDQLTKRLAEQEKQHSILSQALQQTIAKHGEGSLAAQKQELALQKLTNNIDQTKAALNNVGSSASATSNDLRKVDKGATDASNKLNILSQASMNTAKALAGIAVAGIAGVGAALGNTIQRAGEFQQELANLGAVSNATAQQMDTFKNVALEMGSSTKFTATEAAQGLTFLAMAGFNAAEATAALPGVLMAAAAGNMDLAETADIVSNIMGGFQMETSRSSEVADVLAYAAANSNTNISQLGTAFSYIAPVANQAGHSIQSAAAAIGFLSDAGLQGEKAGTVYRQILLRLQAPTNTAAEAMRNLGIQIRNADGTMKSMPDILREFENGLQGVGLAQKDAALKTIFGAEALGGFNILLGRGADSLQEFTTELENSGGSAETMAARQMDSLFGAFELFKSAVDAVAIAIGSRFLPVLQNVIKVATSVISEALPKINAALDAIFDYFNSLANSATDWGNAIGDNFASSLELFTNLIRDNLLPALSGIALAVSAFVLPAIASAVAAFLTMIAPITAVITVGAALGIAWNNNFLGIRDITFSVLDAIKSVITNVIGFVTSFWKENGNSILNNAQSIWNTVYNVISTIVGGIKANIIAIVGAIVTFWQENGNSILGNAQSIWNTVYGVISTIVRDIKANVMVVVGALVTFWQENGDTILAYGKEVWDKVYNIIKTYITLVWEIVKRVFDIVAEIVTTTLSTIQSIVTTVWSAIAGFMKENSNTIELIVNTLWESLKNTINLALGVIQGIITTVLGIVTGDWDKAKSGISTIVETLITFVTRQFETLKKFVTEIGPEMLMAARSIGQSIVDGISQGISAGASAIADAAKSAAKAALDAAKGLLGIKSPSRVFEKEIGGNIIQGMALGLQKTDPIERAMSGMINSIVPTNSGAVTNQTTWNVNINTSQPVNSVLSGLELRQSLVGR